MSPERFLEQFGYLADAPNGITKLRELVLQLAVRGKLVPQDPDDEPASVLLERIRAEKDKLVKEKKIKTIRISESVDKDSAPFAIPHAWEWVSVKAITRDWGQKVPDSPFHYIDVSSINNVRGTINVPSVLSAENAPSRARKIVRSGTVLYSTVRPYLLNIVEVARDFVPEAIASTAFAVLHPLPGVVGKYLWYFLRSPDCVERVSELMRGQAYPAINDKDLATVAVPLPPEHEQSRIVAKVDQLMALCDELEAKQTQRIETHVHLVRAAHHPLTQPRDRAELQSAWQRIRDNFDQLHTTLESVKALRQTILQLAVQGKLVSQDPNDEPASVLLEKIRAEKERLVAEGKIRRVQAQPEIDLTDVPFYLPKGWVWMRLGSLCVLENGDRSKNYPNKSALVDSGIPFINAGHLGDGRVQMHDMNFISQERYDLLRSGKTKPGDILYCLRGSLGKSALVEGIPYAAIASSLVIVRLLPPLGARYFLNYFGCQLATEMVRKYDNGTAQPNLSATDLGKFLVPLAPLGEQSRIVAKVDLLMALCDELEAKIATNQATAHRFTEAVVAELAA